MKVKFLFIIFLLYFNISNSQDSISKNILSFNYDWKLLRTFHPLYVNKPNIFEVVSFNQFNLNYQHRIIQKGKISFYTGMTIQLQKINFKEYYYPYYYSENDYRNHSYILLKKYSFFNCGFLNTISYKLNSTPFFKESKLNLTIRNTFFEYVFRKSIIDESSPSNFGDYDTDLNTFGQWELNNQNSVELSFQNNFNRLNGKIGARIGIGFQIPTMNSIITNQIYVNTGIVYQF